RTQILICYYLILKLKECCDVQGKSGVLEFENNSRSQTADLASENNSIYSSDTNIDFELSTSSDSGEDPIKHIKDFEVISATTRRTGGDEDAVKAFALPFSLEGKAKDWYHTLSNEVTTD
ncbi:hypothetical protein PIB30_059799, partial [Stylosanthes scabra]|nr:hypothetical protein [Stylosanthes scabra]